mmetsp:Transcript_71900/g.199535  ORF Transcript_71900/g.199535 Transcript_71900/m.199535 type:complete len:206 (+) Transcript_71900:432-1049(+)
MERARRLCDEGGGSPERRRPEGCDEPLGCPPRPGRHCSNDCGPCHRPTRDSVAATHREAAWYHEHAPHDWLSLEHQLQVGYWRNTGRKWKAGYGNIECKRKVGHKFEARHCFQDRLRLERERQDFERVIDGTTRYCHAKRQRTIGQQAQRGRRGERQLSGERRSRGCAGGTWWPRRRGRRRRRGRILRRTDRLPWRRRGPRTCRG